MSEISCCRDSESLLPLHELQIVHDQQIKALLGLEPSGLSASAARSPLRSRR